MNLRRRIALLVWIVALCACNLSPDKTASPNAGPSDGISTQLQIQPSVTIAPIQPPTLAPTPTLEKVIARPKDKRVNCRLGPGTVYIILSELNENQSARVAGKSADGAWYHIADPGNPNGFCWVAAEVIALEGNPDSLPVVQSPGPSVTSIVFTVEPQQITVTCDKFPQVVYLTAHITTDAPTLVTYRWEASTGINSADNVIAFESAGVQTVRQYYQIPGPNDYWIKIHILSPNDKSEQANFRALCNP